MKLRNAFGAAIIAALIASVGGQAAAGDRVNVSGHFRSNGNWVAPYTRTAPDSTTSNNWSTIGNTNPITGKAGTHRDTRPGSSLGDGGSFGGGTMMPFSLTNCRTIKSIACMAGGRVVPGWNVVNRDGRPSIELIEF